MGLRQARLIVMHAAKQRLQELSQNPSRLTAEEIRRMQALRYIQESNMDELHKNLIQECTSVRAAASEARMSDLKVFLQKCQQIGRARQLRRIAWPLYRCVVTISYRRRPKSQ